MGTYYLFGKETNNINNIQKIDKSSEKCMWHSVDDNLEKDFIGFFTEKGECYDNCSILGAKSWKKFNDLKKSNNEKFEKFSDSLNLAIHIINEFISLSDKIQSIQGDIRNKKKDLDNGYVFSDTKINGSKKKRRFKKDNRRYLTESEIKKLEKDLEELKLEDSKLCKKLKIEETLSKIINYTFDINLEHSIKLSENYGYGKTVFLYKNFRETMGRWEQKVNDIEYNNRKNYYKEEEIPEIKIFQEAYSKIYNIVEIDKEYEEKTKIVEKRQVSKKTKFYIDEEGNMQRLGDEIDQVVYSK